MSESIDVLAQMESAVASFMEMGWSQDSHPMDDARSAVAELIEAAEDIALYEGDSPPSYFRRLDKAIARVKGE